MVATEFICLFAILYSIFFDTVSSCTNVHSSQQFYTEISSNFFKTMKTVQFIHKTCRNSIYPGSNVNRFYVPDHLVSWSEAFLEYIPVFYESPSLIGKPYADPTIGKLYKFP